MSAVKWSTKITKNTPVDDDQLLIIDSVIPNDQKLITIGTLPKVGGPGTGNTTINAIAKWADANGESLANTGILIDGSTINLASHRATDAADPIDDQDLVTKAFGDLNYGGSFTWASSDEDSPLATGILYVTEAAAVNKTFSLSTLVLTLKNAPTGSAIEVDILQEDGVNSNSFTTIFSTKPTIDTTEFTSQTATIPAVISDSTWNSQRRLQIQLMTNDSNFAATGLKVSI